MSNERSAAVCALKREWQPATFASRIVSCGFVFVSILLMASCGMVSQNSDKPATAITVSGNLPAGSINRTYNAVLSVGGGSSPYQFAVESGILPPGIQLNTTTGSLSGTPTSTGDYSFQVAVTDLPNPHKGTQNFKIAVSSASGVRINVNPPSTNVVSSRTQTFTASVSGSDSKEITWSASGGSITDQGVYTAPAVSSITNFFVTATSKADSTAQGVATVVVEPSTDAALSITNSALPEGEIGSVYFALLSAAGGTTPYQWTVSGSLPAGLSLNGSTGQISGTTAIAGTSNFSISVKDAKSLTATKNFGITVTTSGGTFDGPAELPRVFVPTAMAETPAPGTVIRVNAGGDLKAALSSANCGDTIELQAGATFTGNFKFPAKTCDDSHWIIVRTSAPDSALPLEGQRATPCYAGVTSLPGRPAYTCKNPQNVMAKLVKANTGDGPVVFLTGANHYRLIGLEITGPAGLKGSPTLVSSDNDAIADHIIVDRSWLHGTAHDETNNGFSLRGMNYAAVVDSYFSDFHCSSVVGTCTDAHAVGGGLGTHQDGPFKIYNNFLEASGEAVMFGGGGATKSPTDIEIRRNHFFKPLTWMSGHAGFVGSPTGDPFIVKNHLELKNAVRVLIEANLMENSWGGFSQMGYSILLSPKNQHTQSGDNVCPLCQVTDVTIRYTRMSHAGGGIILATCMSGNGEGGAPALAGTRWSIHDIVIDDLSTKYTGGGNLIELQNGWPANPLNTVTINHITGFPDPTSHVMMMGNLAANPPMYGLTFTNNLVTTGRYPVWNTGGGETSCAYSGTPAQKIAQCFTSYVFSNNALIATPDAFPPSSWPTGNFFPASGDLVGFANFNQGNGGNYSLNSSSQYKNAGTDGKDLGADIASLESALAGVE